MIEIKSNVHQALADSKLQRNLDKSTIQSETARISATNEVENWEDLRTYARQVKAHTLSSLPEYLEELENRITESGGNVIWADTASDALSAIIGILQKEAAKTIVKSKSMLGEEIHLNEALENEGLEVVETDLGEYIIQLCGETPSHIVTPALHKSKEEVGALFEQKLGMEPTDDVEELTLTARSILRSEFLKADAGISGVNFGIAETGTIVIVENEGNARLSTSLPQTHIAIMGIEKVIPRVVDLPIFLKLLTRSATGQRITSYINLISGPRREEEQDGPEDFYLILIDNGRSRIHQDVFLRQTLSCIRCGACLNACPVFQRMGGHAYGTVYQGPIGAILMPQLLSLESAPEHPFVSSLCGACKEVCPVKIEIPEILLELRHRVKSGMSFEKLTMRVWAWMMQSSLRYRIGFGLIRRVGRILMGKGKLPLSPPAISNWQKDRNLPDLPKRSFREEYERLKGDR